MQKWWTALLVGCLLVAEGAYAGRPILVRGDRPSELPYFQRSTPAGTQPFVPSDALDLLSVIAQFPSAEFFATGDANHDGRAEVYISRFNPSFGYECLVFEYGPSGGLVQVAALGPYFVYAVGDIDQDGLRDMVCQHEVTAQLEVVESASTDTYPSNVVWQSPPLANFNGYASVADTDRDGALEILYSINGFGNSKLLIYECTGDNAFAEVFRSQRLGQPTRRKLIADLNGNGYPEIAMGGVSGFLEIFEASANNSWAMTFSDTTGMLSAYDVAGGIDTDHNGRPELFYAGDVDQDPISNTTRVYEYQGGTYHHVTTLEHSTGHWGLSWNGLFVLSPGETPEYAFALGPTMLVYRNCGVGCWTFDRTITHPSHEGNASEFIPLDLNRNGRDEIYWTTEADHNSIVLERPTVATDLSVTPSDFGIQIAPSPTPWNAMTLSSRLPLPSGTRFLLYDAAGHQVAACVDRAAVERLPQTRPLANGVYILRAIASNARFLGQTRIVVVK